MYQIINDLINAINNLAQSLNKYTNNTQIKPTLAPINPETIVKLLPVVTTVFLVVFTLVQLMPTLKDFLKADFLTPKLSKEHQRFKNAKVQFWIAFRCFAFSLVWMVLYVALYNLLIICLSPTFVFILSIIGPLVYAVGMIYLFIVISKWGKDLIGG